MSEPCMPPAQQSRSDMAAHMAHLGLLESCILVLWQKNSPRAPTLLYCAAFLQLTCRPGVFSTAPVHTHNLVAFLNNRSIITRMILCLDNAHFLYRTRRINCAVLYAQRCVFTSGSPAINDDSYPVTHAQLMPWYKPLVSITTVSCTLRKTAFVFRVTPTAHKQFF